MTTGFSHSLERLTVDPLMQKLATVPIQLPPGQSRNPNEAAEVIDATHERALGVDQARLVVQAKHQAATDGVRLVPEFGDVRYVDTARTTAAAREGRQLLKRIYATFPLSSSISFHRRSSSRKKSSVIL